MTREHDDLWRGEFGSVYLARNRGERHKARALAFMARALARAPGIRSVIEFGANVGHNLDAVAALVPGVRQAAVEIHPDACEALAAVYDRTIHCCSLAQLDVTRQYDLAFTKGVLIHIPPADLPAVYERLYRSSSRYVMVAEYYNPQPVTVTYRGRDDALWKRDFAGEMMSAYPDLRLVDYGFVSKYDALAPEDDVTWWLMAR
jgi:spore coat polysaccharide biosynthesis protein SpsF